MRPIRLHFAGLRSYREPAEINFDGLDLFAVIGDTGAGKSTIIEALSLALYARKTWSGGAKLEELIADGEKMLRVDFTFATGDRTWQVTRTRNRNTTPGVNKLFCVETREHVDGADQVTARITELLGLDHSQFTRAVVLPQGRFDEMLQSRPAERNKLLASILGLDDVRRAGTAADTLAKRLEPVVAAAASRRGTLPDDPAGALADAQAAATRAETLRDQLAAAVAEATTIEARAARLASAAKQLDAVRRVVPKIGNWLDTLAQAQEDGERLSGQRTAATEALARAAGGEADVTVAEDRLLAGFTTRDAAITARTELAGAAEALEAAETDLIAAQDLVARLEANPPTANVPAELIDAEDAAGAAYLDATTARAAASTQLEKARHAFDTVAAARETARAADEATETARAANDDAATALSAAEAAEAEASEAAETADERYRAAVAASAAAVAAQGCGPGDACPVCTRDLPDSFEAPEAPDVELARQEQAATQAAAGAAGAAKLDARRGLTDTRKCLDEARDAANAARRNLDTAKEEAAGVNIDAADVDAATADHCARLADAEAVLEGATAAQRDAHDAVTMARARVDAAAAGYRSQLDAARASVDTAEHRARTARTVVDQLPGPWRPDGLIGPTALRNVAQQITTMITDLDVLGQRRRDLVSERRSAEQTLNRTTEAIATTVTAPAQRAVGELNAYLARVDDIVDVVTQTAPVIEQAVTTAASGTVDIDTGTDWLGDTITDARARQSTATATLAAASELAEALNTAHTAAAADLDTVLQRTGLTDLTTLRHQAGVAESEATTARKQAEAAAGWAIDAERLDAVLATARPFAANLHVLATALRDQHFLGHLVKAREAELLAEATRRLKVVTGGRFGFVTDFGVVRLASGEVRSPDTLSGGERFQAALALALALVEIASRGGGHLDAIFVDEGFGSLDATALETALATLATVAGGGRTVALISHLRPVAEYVDTVLHVTKDDVLGSRIDVLDPDARDHLLADDIRAGLTT